MLVVCFVICSGEVPCEGELYLLQACLGSCVVCILYIIINSFSGFPKGAN